MYQAVIVAALLASTAANAQTSPGWSYWNEWQCGPYVRIVVSIDGKGGTDFFVRGAWFDNHYTLRSNGLFYNGIACVEVRPSRLPRGWVGHGPVVE